MSDAVVETAVEEVAGDQTEVTPTETPVEDQVETPVETSEETPSEETPTTIEETQETPSELPVDFTDYHEEFKADGKLSDGSYEALATKGYPRELVDTYIKGQSSVVGEDQRSGLIETAGGEEAYGTLIDWAAQNMPRVDVEKYNRAIANADTAEFALEWLQGKREAVEGKPAAVTLEGGTPPATTADVFTSTAQVTAAMKDPRYKRDAAYQAEVAQKMARSNIF